MTRYEYKVCPAPTKGRKGTGVKGAEARFAHGLELVMNEMGAEGWDYVRSDILPSEERQGLTSTQTVYRSVLVFRRAVDQDAAAVAPIVDEPSEDTPPEPEAQDELYQSEPDHDAAPSQAPEEVHQGHAADDYDGAEPEKDAHFVRPI